MINKKGIAKIGAATLVVVIFALFLFFLLIPYLSSSVLDKDKYFLGEKVKIDLKNYENYKLKIVTPSLSYVKSGDKDSLVFSPTEIGKYQILIESAKGKESYNFEVVSKEISKNINKDIQIKNYSNFDFSINKVYVVGENIKFDLRDFGNYELQIIGPKENISRVGNNDWFIFGVKDEGDYKIKLKKGGGIEEYRFKAVLIKPQIKDIIQNSAEIGKPVTWTAEIKNKSFTLSINVSLISNISVKNNSGSLLNYSIVIIDNNTIIKINDNSSLNENFLEGIKIEFQTPGPIKTEKQISLDKKEVVVSSPSTLDYSDVLAYTNLPEVLTLSKKDLIKIYWKEENKYLDFNAIDSNGNGLIDRVEWVVSHLSNQTFDVSIIVLNIHSNPTLYGNWIVQFLTVGNTDLKIVATIDLNYTKEITKWSNYSENSSLYDLKFFEIRCGNKSLNYEWIGDDCNNKECYVLIRNYSCDKTGYGISKVLTSKKHVLKFIFNDKEAFAYNDVLNYYMFLFWDDTNIPQNWTCVSCNSTDQFYQRFIKGNDTFGGAGGEVNHTHTATSISVTQATTYFRRPTGTNMAANTHTHGNSSISISNTSNIPSYKNLKVIKYNYGIPNRIPAGAIAIFNSSSIPQNWTRYSLEDNYFIRGENDSSSGGSNIHNHTVSFTLTASSGIVALNTGAGSASANNLHTHTVNGISNNSNNTPPYISVILAKADIDCYVPDGMIVMFNQTPSSPDWSSVSNSGNDFYGKFIIGNSSYGQTGGSINHTHLNFVNYSTPASATTNARAPTLTNANAAQGSHTHTATVGFSADNNLPPYIDVIFGYFKDKSFPLISFGNLTEITGTNFSRNWIYTDVSVVEENEVNITFYLYNTTSPVNITTFTDFRRTINWTNLLDGIYYYNVSVVDSGNNRNITETRKITLDNTPPLVTIVNPQNITYNTQTIPFNFTLNEQGSCWYSLTGGAVNYTMTTNASRTGFNATNNSIADGSYVVNAYCNDSGGNKNYTVTRGFGKDSTQPNINIISPLNQNYTTTMIQFNVSLNENSSWCGFSLDNKANTTMTRFNDTYFNYANSTMSQGSHNVIFSCNDTLGNMNSSIGSTVNFFIDSISPLVTILSPEVKNYSSSAIYFNVSLNEAGSCWYSLTSGAVNYTMTANASRTGFNSTNSSIADGQYTVRYFCNDSYGNFNDTQNISFNLDRSSPFLYIIYPQNISYTINVSQLNYSFNDLSPGYCWYSINNGQTNSSSVPSGQNFSNAFSIEGSNSWTLYCNDSFGNLNFTSVTFFKDTVFPLISIVYPLNSSNFSTKNIGVNYTAFDINLQACWWTNNSGVNNHSVNCGQNITGQLWDEGLNTIFVYANDSAGNKNFSRVSFRVDATPPIINIISPPNGSSYSTSVISFNVSLNEAGSWCGFSLDNAANITMTKLNDSYFNYTETGLSTGDHNLTFSCNDTIGNMNSSSGLRYFGVDTVAPQVTIINPQNITYNVGTILFNFTLDESGTCWYSLTNGIVNYTMTANSSNTGFNATNNSIVDGNYNVRAYCNDSAGNLNLTTNLWFSKDATAPNGTLITPPNATLTNNVTQNLTVNATDNIGLSNVTLNVWNQTASINQTTAFVTGTQAIVGIIYTFLYDGIFKWFYRVTDLANNIFIAGNNTITIDTTPPIINIVSPLSSQIYNLSIIDFNVSLSENTSFCKFSFDNWQTNYTMSRFNETYFNYTNNTVSRGNYSVMFWCNDSLNNINSSSYVSLNISGYLIFNISGLEIYSSNLPNYDLTKQVITGVNPVTLEISGTTLATMDVNFSNDLNWIDVFGDFGNYTLYSILYGKSFIHIPSLNHSEVSNIKLFIPVLEEDSGLIFVCPNVSSLDAVDENCPGMYYSYSVQNVSGYYNISVNSTGSAQTARARLVIWDGNDSQGGSQVIYQFQQANFYANWTNRTSGRPINGSNVNCNITFNVSGGWTSWANMNFNSTSLLYEYNRSFSNNGTFKWNVTCVGNPQGYGTIRTNDTIKIAPDLTLPNGTLISPPNATITNNPTQNLTANATDNIGLSNVTLNVWNQTASINQTTAFVTGTQALVGIIYTFLYDGIFKWFYQIVDIAGNTFITQNNTITIDTTNPLILFGNLTEQNYSYFSRNWIYANVSVTELIEANITFSLSNDTELVNQTTFSAGNRTINWTNLVDGIYYYNITVVDLANNKNSTETRTITLDTTNPLINYSSGTEENNSEFERDWIYVNVSVSEVNFANITFGLYNNTNGITFVNETIFNSLIYEINWTGLSNTNVTYFYNLTVYDLVNHFNKTETRSIKLIDITPPYVEITSPQNPSYDSNTSLTLSFIASDPNLQSCWYNLNNGNNQSVDCQLGTTFNCPEGTNTLYLFANDSLGNTNSTNVTFYANNSLVFTNDYYVQRGIASVNGNQNVTINEVDSSKSFILFSVKNSTAPASSNPNAIQVTSKFINSTTIRFENYAGGGAQVNWEVITGPDIFVQRGEIPYNITPGNLNVSIISVDTTQSFIIVNNRLNTATTANNVQGFWTGKFIGSNILNLQRGATGSAGNVSWQVVQWSGTNVQNGSSSGTGTTGSVTLDSSVNIDNSFLIFSSRIAGGTTLQDTVIGGIINSPTTLVFYKAGGAATWSTEWFVISWNRILSQRGQRSYTTPISLSVSITTLYYLNKSFSFISRSSTGGATGFLNSLIASQITNNTNIQFDRASTSNTINASYQVMEIIELTPPAISLKYPFNGYNFSSFLIPSFNYSVNDSSFIMNCSLFGNWTTGWQRNQTVLNPMNNISITQNFSRINILNDGYYIWNVECVDIYGNIGYNSTDFSFGAFLFPYSPILLNISQTSNEGLGNITLFWNSSNHSILYKIYYNSSMAGNFTFLNETSLLNFTDASFSGQRRRFYRIDAWNPTGQNSSSDYFGAHVYSLRKVSNGNTRNWIGFPTNFSYLRDANRTLKEIRNATSFTMWNETIQKRVVCNLYSCPSTFECTETNCNFNFSNQQGRGYEVNINSSAPNEVNWSGVGIVFINEVNLTLIKNSTSWAKNWIGVYANTTLNYAKDLLTSINSSETVTKWDSTLQRSRGFMYSPFAGVPFIGTNFSLDLESGYEVSVNGTTQWGQV